jgi:tRNA-dihydrouridine synthase
VKGTLSVKIRAGYDEVDRDFTQRFCSMIAEEGADWVVIHPRAAKLAFRRSADWNVIRHVSERLSIPVVGNGDISTPADALGKLGRWCDGVMIARRAVQEPWIFSQCESKSRGEPGGTVDLLETGRAVLDGIEKELPPEMHKSRAHRFLFYYCKNFIFGHQLFTEIRNTKSISVMTEALEGYCERNRVERFRDL